MLRLHAQTDIFKQPWRWTHFTTESGLPTNNVFEVIESPDSTLWAICDAGIAWYDSFQWHTVQLPAPLLPENKTYPCDYRADSILVGLANGEWYAVGRSGFSKIPVEPYCRMTYLSGDTLLYLSGDSLFLFSRDLNRSFAMIEQLKVKGFKVLSRSKGRRVWITSKEGLYRWEGNYWRLMFALGGNISTTSFHIDENSAGAAVFAQFEFSLKMRGLWQYSPMARIPRRITGDPEDIRDIAIGPSQMLVASYFFGEVRIYTGNSWSNSAILAEKCKNLNNLFFRRNGDLVVATSEGIHYYKGSSSCWHLLPNRKPNIGAVDEILVTRSGDIWIGTANGLVIYRKDGTSKILSHIGDVQMITITGLGEDRDGNIWVSSGGSFGGAFRWDGSTWTYFRITDSKDGARFHKIRKDSRGRLWFLGLTSFLEGRSDSEPGVFILDGREFKRFDDGGCFSGKRVYAFAEDSQGGLWFGTDGGISRWKNGVWRQWAMGQGLSHYRVFTLAIDQQNDVWFGHQVEGFGLGRIDTTGAVRYFTTTDGLVNDYVWEVCVDSQGVLWIATRGGLGSYRNGTWSRFDESSGLPSNLLWPVVPLNDEVYVGTHGKGVAILNRKQSFAPGPRIVIDRPIIDKQDVYLSWHAFSFWGIKSPSEILTQYRIDDGPWSDWNKKHELYLKNIASGEHRISVQARGSFGNDSSEVQSATFTVLAPLLLRPVVYIPAVVLILGLATLGFIIVIRKRRYAIGLRQREARFRAVMQMTYSAIFIWKDNLSIIFSNNGMERLTGYSQAELLNMKVPDILSAEHGQKFFGMNKSKVSDKELQLRDEFVILNKNGNERWIDLAWGSIMFQEEQAMIGTAFDVTDRKQAELRIRTLASELSATEQRSRKKMAAFLHDKIGHALALSKMKVESLLEMSEQPPMHQTVREVHEMLRDAIQTTRSFTFELSPPILYDLGLVPAIDWLVEELQRHEKIKATLQKPISKIRLADEVRNVLFEGTRELLINSVKHSRAKNIAVSVTARDSTITIEVQDNGVGFNVSSLDQHQAGSKSFGLHNLRDRLKDVGGSIEIESSPEKGTTVRLIAPVIK